jgi:hypothetical protein
MIFRHPKLLVEVMHLTTAIALRGTEVTPPVGTADIDRFEDALQNESIRALTGCVREEVAPLPSATNRRIERHLGPFRLAELPALSFERQQGFVGLLMGFVHGEKGKSSATAWFGATAMALPPAAEDADAVQRTAPHCSRLRLVPNMGTVRRGGCRWNGKGGQSRTRA